MKQKHYILGILIILVIGMYFRGVDLSTQFAHPDDFGVAKTIFDSRQAGLFGAVKVPQTWTYAPLQYFVTPFLIGLDQDYRSLLFWGRLPSFGLAVIGLLGFLFFYQKWKGPRRAETLLALTLFACSWQNIIFAKQINNYAAGVTGFVFVLILLLDNLHKKNDSLLRILCNSFLLALICHLQYSLLFSMPSFFLVAFMASWRQSKHKWATIGKYLAGGVSYLAFIFPMLHFFLFPLIRKGLAGVYGWNKGPHGEFFFTLDGLNGPLEIIAYIVKFFTINSYYAFQSTVSFIPETSPWLTITTAGLLLLAAMGTVSFVFSKQSIKHYFALFFGVLAIVWISLIVTQRLTLSPTRHHLILLPGLIMAISEGAVVFAALLAKAFKSLSCETAKTALNLGLSAVILLLFTTSAPAVIAKRQDAFQEEEIINVLKKYNVDALVTTVSAQQPELMKSVRDYFDYNGENYIHGLKVTGIMTDGATDYKRLAIISFRQKLTPDSYAIIVQKVNNFISLSNRLRENRGLPPLTFIRSRYQDHVMLYEKEIDPRVENGYSSRTDNGGNGFYFYVLERL